MLLHSIKRFRDFARNDGLQSFDYTPATERVGQWHSKTDETPALLDAAAYQAAIAEA
jgi:hypothetical protein